MTGAFKFVKYEQTFASSTRTTKRLPSHIMKLKKDESTLVQIGWCDDGDEVSFASKEVTEKGGILSIDKTNQLKLCI